MWPAPGSPSHHHLHQYTNLMSEIIYRQYAGEPDLPHIMALVQSELSEPYVIYTFRYFLHQWYVPPSYSLPVVDRKKAPSIVPCKFYGLMESSVDFHGTKAYSSDPEVSEPVGVIVCKQSMHRDLENRGYIAMLSVRKEWRNRGIGQYSLPPPLPALHSASDQGENSLVRILLSPSCSS